MKQECIDAVTRAAGRDLTKAEIDGIDSRMRTSLRDLSMEDHAAFMAKSPAERVSEAAKLSKDRMIEDTVKAHEQAVQELSKRAALDDFRESFVAGKNGRLLAAMHKLFYDAGSKAGDTSVEVNRKAILGDFMRQLGGLHEYDQGKFFGHLQDPTKQAQIIKEIFEPGSSGEPEAAKVADQINKVLKFAKDRADRAGVGFHELDNWRLPQPSDWTKVGADRNAWVDSHMDWVDRRAYVNADGTRMSDPQLKDFLEHVWETQATNGSYKRAESENTGGNGVLGVSRSMPRQLHYKDYDAYRSAMDQYGRSTNAYSLLRQHLDGVAKDVSLAETMGRNADDNFKYLIEKSFGDDVLSAKTDKERNALATMKKSAYRQWDILRNGEGVGNQVWANRMAGVRSVISSTMLGGLFGAVPDAAMVSLTARLNGMPQMKAMAQMFKGAFSKADGEMMERLGLTMEAAQAAAHRFGTEELGVGVPRFLNSAVHHLSGLAMLDRGMRSGIGLSMMDLLGKLTREKSLSDLQEGDHAFLVNSKGVKDEHWNVWKLAETDGGPNNNRTLLTPDAIYNIPNEKIDPLIEKQVASRSQVFKDAIDKATERSATESSWITKRIEKFHASLDKANQWLQDYDARRQTKLGEAQSKVDAQAELLRAKIESAGVEADIAGYLKTEKVQDKIRNFLYDVEDGAKVNVSKSDRAVENYGREVNKIGETYGQRRAAAEAKIKEAQKKVDAYAKEASAEIEGKAKDLIKRFTEQDKALDQFKSDIKDRIARRQEYTNEYQKQVGDVIAQERDRAKSDAVTKLLSSVLTETQAGARGATGASISDKVTFGLDQMQAGTLSGEIARMFFLMKQTPLGIAKTHLFDRPAGMNDWQSAWKYRAQFIAMSTVLGALSIQLKTLATGANPEDITDHKFWQKALIAGGGFGIYGDLFMADTSHHNNGLLSLIGGPGATAMEDVIAGYGSMKKDFEESGSYNYGSHLLGFAKKYAMPLTNLWYVKAAFNHLIYQQMQDVLNPGYSARLQQKMQSTYKQSFWWAPGHTSPDTAPDLSRALPD